MLIYTNTIQILVDQNYDQNVEQSRERLSYENWLFYSAYNSDVVTGHTKIPWPVTTSEYA